ncbi:MAG: M10 family metallopeptidase C-terminal domain-containing protein [Proteobacteria bacterium]|nr:M10 family metallopeptidase C-terminal domain-containing protein [Pseudomonadota bacterium]
MTTLFDIGTGAGDLPGASNAAAVHDGAVREPGCGCAACAQAAEGAEAAGDGLSGLNGSKPIFSTDQVVNNFLRSNAAWLPGSTIQFAFRDAKPAGAAENISFVAFSEIERAHTRLGFDLISDLVNLSFVEVADDGRSTNVSDKIYFGKDSAAPSFEWGHAIRYTRGTHEGGRRTTVAGDVWVSDAAQASRQWFAGGYNFQALMHEQLHTLGLPHPGNYNANGQPITYATNAEYAQDSRQFSIMSYFSASNTGSDHMADSRGGLYSGATPLLHDVAALQALYGANMNTRTGDTVYGYNSTAGRTPFDFNQNTTPIFTIWDAGGVDRLDFSQTAFRVNLDLNPGAFSDSHEMTNNISIALGVTIEDAVGGFANDRLSGNGANNRLQGGAGDDELLGQGGDDLLEGGDGRDALRGGEGDDRMGGQDGDDFLDGGNGRDELFGDAGNDLVVGGTDNDRLHGQDGDDRMGGQDGDDFLDGGAGRDNLFGDGGNDTLVGGGDADRLHGQDGDDLMGGQDGDDFLEGGAGRDTLFGDAGDDILIGGEGADLMFGQGGADLFIFSALSDSPDSGRDRIGDFDAAAGDRIDLTRIDADIFTAGDQAFTFTGAFTGRAGEAVLNFDAGSNLTTLSLDVNGDLIADFRLEIVGAASPSGFVL